MFELGDPVEIIANENNYKDIIKNTVIIVPNFVSDMKKQFGEKGIITDILYGIVQVGIPGLKSYFWHPDWLKKVEASLNLETNSNLETNTICRKCKSPAYIGFNDIQCPNCGRY